MFVMGVWCTVKIFWLALMQERNGHCQCDDEKFHKNAGEENDVVEITQLQKNCTLLGN